MSNTRNKGTLYIVVPCYNEEEAIENSAKALLDKLTELINKDIISDRSKIVFVDDGSKDRTWELIEEIYQKNKSVTGLRFAHNRGHQNAILAGMMFAKDYCDYTITIDADLQQDINAIELFIKEYGSGSEIVYGVRNSRNTDSFFKKTTATVFYKMMGFLGCNVYENSADYRLMSSKALDALSEYSEINLFLRGMIPLIGYKSTSVYYERNERFAGESKYPLKKMLAFAMNGITSFSVKPLKIITGIGFLMVFLSMIAFIWAFVAKFIGESELGWSSLICSIWFIGGLQILCLGVIGEYIGKIYAEVKQRPRYIVAEFINSANKKENT